MPLPASAVPQSLKVERGSHCAKMWGVRYMVLPQPGLTSALLVRPVKELQVFRAQDCGVPLARCCGLCGTLCLHPALSTGLTL